MCGVPRDADGRPRLAGATGARYRDVGAPRLRRRSAWNRLVGAAVKARVRWGTCSLFFCLFGKRGLQGRKFRDALVRLRCQLLIVRLGRGNARRLGHCQRAPAHERELVR